MNKMIDFIESHKARYSDPELRRKTFAIFPNAISVLPVFL